MKKKIWEIIKDIAEYACLFGLGRLFYDAYGYNWQTWLGLGFICILCMIHAHEVYRLNNKEYFEQKEKKD